jgi:hypothetical protein
MEYDTGTDPKLDSETSKGKGKLLDSAKKARKWQTELNASKKWMARFTKAARDCEKAYLDMSDGEMASLASYAGKTNLFWSNVQVVLSAIYGRLPTAEVNRKFKDFDDDVARVAGVMMQRILTTTPTQRCATRCRTASSAAWGRSGAATTSRPRSTTSRCSTR